MNKHRFENGTKHVEELRLTPGLTEEIVQAVTDEADSFDEAEYTNDAGELAVAAQIEVHASATRYAFGVDPVADGLGYPKAVGDEILLDSPEQIENFRWINDVATEIVTLTVTFFFRNA